ncbi:hypothetical protein JZ751_028159 [Albula glossodonta]|uniref:Uncharacterized protein n=1 Tax=Albula glossodonta TaxID=121402 RepID=A0A8T2PET7_9TELE|nr:hypothetical protein JZ751_028159 [Albula glossodonta]
MRRFVCWLGVCAPLPAPHQIPPNVDPPAPFTAIHLCQNLSCAYFISKVVWDECRESESLVSPAPSIPCPSHHPPHPTLPRLKHVSQRRARAPWPVSLSGWHGLGEDTDRHDDKPYSLAPPSP